MNYIKLYNSIIENALSKNRSKTDGYFENHHIIPKCFGGSNSKDNMVLLTAKEHFICHALLVEIHRDDFNKYCKMLHAFMLMKGNSKHQRRYINSKMYEKIKKEYAEIRRANTKGKKLTDEHKSRISESLKGRVMSVEVKEAISKKAKERVRKPFSEEYKLRMSLIMKNKNKLKVGAIV